MKKAFFKAILRQEIGWFDKHGSGELTTRLADDLERVREGLGDKFSICLQWFAAFIAGFVIGFIKGWKLTLVMMSLSPLLAICASFMGKFVASFTKREQESYAQAGKVAEEVLSCIRTVVSFNGHKREIDRYAVSLEHGKKLGIRKAMVVGFGIGTTLLIMFGAYGLAFWFGSTEVDAWQKAGMKEGIGLSPGEVFTVFFCVLIGSFSIGNAAPHITTVSTAKGAAATLLEIIDNKPSIDSSSPEGDRPRDVTGTIDFVGVNFAYPTRKKVQVLKNFNLSIKPGQTVALVGSSGCGKSTCVNLILRFYDPVSGSIYLDGHSLQDLNVAWLRRKIGVVSQEPVLFGCTIEENILLGRENVTMDEVIAAAKMANAHDFISALPEGYQTLVGERGAQLSGGQKQRVAIARALVRDPKILLLDEATSALDSESEGVVQAALDKASQGRTTLVIAHRLSTVRNADVIYVLDEGQIVEEGKHEELMEKKGAYYQLVTLQTFEQDSNPQAAENHEDGGEETTEERGLVKRSLSRQGSRKEKAILKRQLSRKISKVENVAEEEEEDVDKPGFCRMFKENKPEWPFVLLGCIAAAINGCTMPLFAVFFSEVVKVFQKTGEEMRSSATFWSLMFVALGGVNFLANSIQSTMFGNSGERLTMRLRLKTFQNIIRQDIGWFDDPKHSTGALTTRLATDAPMVKNATGIRLATIIQSAVSLVAGLVIAFIFGWELSLVVMGTVPILAIAGFIQMRVVQGNQKRDSGLMEDAGKIASEAIDNVKTVQSLTKELHFYDKYSNFLQKPYKENLKQALVYALAFAFSQGIIFMLYGGAFRFGAYMVTLGRMSGDEVYRVFFAITFTGLAVGQASSFLPDYSKARLAAGHIFRLLDTVPLIDIYSKKGCFVTDVVGDIVLKDVIFRYPSRPNVPVLTNMDLSVKAGQTVALVGVSGCGKSTVVSLLQRYYDPMGGEIIVDGTNIKDLNLGTYRSFLSVVSQEPILFDLTIFDNIIYGLEREVSMAEVIEATRTANIHEFISSLPLGYDTMVGEKGTQLSGGQKQRIAIARALVRNPRILLLDEATSALDTESEKLVQTALDSAQEGRTCIVIAHRLSTIQNADIIFLIEGGRIIERGTHAELVAAKGAYSALVSGQQIRK
ncbi:ATP-dependent translocase ABCB1-like isoform X2 [Liolophura sinensis]